MRGLDSLILFNSKYPFVRKLLAEALKLNHPLQRFVLHLNNQDQHWMHHLNPKGNEFRRNHTFQVKENLFLLTATLLLAGKIGSNENVSYSTPGAVTDMVTFEKQESRQLHLAQAAQMLYLFQRIHETVRNNYDEESNELDVSTTKKENDKGNKIATIVGDLFFAEMFNLLSKVENNQVVKFMSETLVQFSQENFPLQQSENLSTSVSMRLDHGNNKGGWKEKELTLFPKGCITSPMALELLFGNSFYCTAILNGQKEDKLQLLGSHFGKLYFSHKRVLYLIEYLLNSNEAQTTMGKSANNAVQSGEILENLRLELDKLRTSNEEIVNAFNSMHNISSDVRFALGSITDYLSYHGVNFNDEPEKFILELF